MIRPRVCIQLLNAGQNGARMVKIEQTSSVKTASMHRLGRGGFHENFVARYCRRHSPIGVSGALAYVAVRNRSLGKKPDEPRLLELLSGSDEGTTDSLLTTHAFRLDVLIGLVRAGLATAQAERTRRQAGQGHQGADHGRGAAGPGGTGEVRAAPRPRGRPPVRDLLAREDFDVFDGEAERTGRRSPVGPLAGIWMVSTNELRDHDRYERACQNQCNPLILFPRNKQK